MIPRAHITAWRAQAPWGTDAQVEQDLVLTRAVVEIFRHPLLRETLDHWLGPPKREQTASAVRFIYRFESEGPPTTPLRLKIEINTREHLNVLPLEARTFGLENPWFSGQASVRIYALEELLGTKLRALYQRKKGRDLFDLAGVLERAPGLRTDEVVRCFGAYLAAAGQKVSRAEFEANLEAKLQDTAFKRDIEPLLVPDAWAAYDATAAGQRVRRALLAALPGEPWKGHP